MKNFFVSLATLSVVATGNSAFAQNTGQSISSIEMIGAIIIGAVFIIIIAILACPDLTTTLFNLFSRKRDP